MTPTLHLVPAFGMPAGMEWLVILIIALLLFGSKLPSVMRGLGGSIKEFKKGMDEGDKPKTEAPIAPEGAISRESKPVVESTSTAAEKK
jgi:sec-independent protein translocase protein TatA